MAGIIRKSSSRKRKLGKKRFHVWTLFLVAVLSVFCMIGVWNAGSFLFSFFGRESNYDTIILQAGIRNGVDPRLIKAVIWRESKFNARARGTKGEVGLMQIMPKRAAVDWARAKGFPAPTPGALYQPELNIEVGSWYLGRAMQRWRLFKNGTALALCEYNAGLKSAHKWKPEKANGEVVERITFPTTKKYVSQILGRYEKYKREWKILQ